MLLVVVGLPQLSANVLASQVVAEPQWREAVLLLVFAYGGFESMVIAASETRDPRRDTGPALIAAGIVVTLIYCLLQLVIVGVLPDAGTNGDTGGLGAARNWQRPRRHAWQRRRRSCRSTDG